MFDNLKIMNKDVKCKKCGAEIKFKDKICPQCRYINNRPLYLLVGVIAVAVILVIIIRSIISSVVGSVKKNQERKVTYKWPTTGVAALLPEPDLEYGKIINDSADYFSIELYFAEKSDFDKYVDKCKEKGFIVGYQSADTMYVAKDDKGNKLDVKYSDLGDEPEIRISIDSAARIAEQEAKNAQSKAEAEAKKQAEEAAKAQKVEEANKRTEELTNKINESLDKYKNSSSSSNVTDFRKWVDDYEKWMNDYVDFMNNYNASDLSQLTKYTKLLADYSKWAGDAANLKQSDYSPEDWAYFIAAQARVNERLASVNINGLGQ